jgi:hypothetical protein
MSLSDNTITPPLVINFNSKDRIQGTNSSFLSAPVDLGNNQFDSVCLVQASIPKSFYNCPSGYNTFVLREFDGVTTSNATITIPPGSYTRINFQSTLATLLTDNSPDGLTYTVSYPASTEADTFHYTFNVNVGSAWDISFIFSATSPYRQMGFDIGTYTFSDISITNSELESVNAINLSFILRAFIKTTLVMDATDGILEELLNFGSFPANSVMSYQQFNFDMNTRKYNTSGTNSWLFSLVDSFDQLIDLNGIPWAFSVVFYQRNTTHELQKTELQIANEERLYRIEQEQKRIEDQLQINNSSMNQAPDIQGNLSASVPTPLSDIKPLYQQVPFGITTEFIPKL